ncbi:MAG: hypothetical protein ACK5O9_03835 [Holosporales bacterium]|jgi:hypothetical protein
MSRNLLFILLLFFAVAAGAAMRSYFNSYFVPSFGLLLYCAVGLQSRRLGTVIVPLLAGLGEDALQSTPLGTNAVLFLLSFYWIKAKRDIILVLPHGGRWLLGTLWFLFLQAVFVLWLAMFQVGVPPLMPQVHLFFANTILWFLMTGFIKRRRPAHDA